VLSALNWFDCKYALFILGVIALFPGCGNSDPKPPKKAAWTYRMQGNLDDQNLRCTGEADVKPAAGESKCWTWQVSKTNCQGNNDVDWLHESDMIDTVCPAKDGWELKKELSGRAVCTPTVVVDGQAPASLTLSCTWECRDAKFPCSGSATYDYHKDK
jgi:hypothetical protein